MGEEKNELSKVWGKGRRRKHEYKQERRTVSD